MFDITKCDNAKCSAHDKCLRYICDADQFRQAYFAEVVGMDEECEYFIDASGGKDT